MGITNQVELLEKSVVKVKITITADEIKKEYDDVVKKYCKTLQIPGFRKGKVPSDILVRKFGDALKGETVQSIIEKSAEEILKSSEHKPLPYSQPKLNEENPETFELDKDYSYELTYETFPKIELENYSNLETEEDEVVISDEDINEELKHYQEQNALIVEKKDPVVAKDDIITIDYVELDNENNEIETTRRESFTFTVGTGYNLYMFDDDMIGMKKDEEKIIKKSLPEDYQYAHLAGKDVTLKVKITNVKEKNYPELNDDLAQDISEKYQTLQDLKDDILKKFNDAAQDKIKNNMIYKIIDSMITSNKIELPESMILQNIQMRFQSMMQQFKGNEQALLNALSKRGSEDSLVNEMRPVAERELKEAFIVEALARKENIDVTDDEVEESIKIIAESRKSDFETTKQEIIKQDAMESVKLNLRNEKLFTHLLKNIKINKGKKYSYREYFQKENNGALKEGK